MITQTVIKYYVLTVILAKASTEGVRIYGRIIEMAVSNWILYIGVFLCATGFGVVIGAIFIFYWGIQKLEEAKQGNSYTENNYTANIDHYHADDGGSDNTDNSEPWKTAANPNGTSRDYISKDTLEESR